MFYHSLPQSEFILRRYTSHRTQVTTLMQNCDHQVWGRLISMDYGALFHSARNNQVPRSIENAFNPESRNGFFPLPSFAMVQGWVNKELL